ncbi:MAG: Ppx/GppA family phosphatase [Pseudomonadota bacterium]
MSVVVSNTSGTVDELDDPVAETGEDSASPALSSVSAESPMEPDGKSVPQARGIAPSKQVLEDALERLTLSRWAAQSAATADRDVALQGGSRLAVIDMGSNSVRLVVYDMLCRAPVPLFNEKALCGLGRGLSVTGRLDDDAMAETLRVVARYAAIARGLESSQIEILATAAVREAQNGSAFATEVESVTGVSMRVLTGEDEARLSAYGVIGGIPGARGVMEDLGGGSLELVTLEDPLNAKKAQVANGLQLEVGDSLLGPFTTLPLGPLRLIDQSDGDMAKAEAIVAGHLANVDWLNPKVLQTALSDGGGKALPPVFYPVGGAWRTLAKLHMHESDYALRVIHHYAISASDAIELARDVSRRSAKILAKIPAISRRRSEALPYAALVMAAVLERIQADNVVFSAYGLREGFLFSELSQDQLARDPLIEASIEIGRHDNRHSDIGDALFHWLTPAFPDETPARRRVRHAVCHLSDVAWREHPDYRANAASRKVLQAPMTGLTHGERAFIALAVYARYGGEETRRAMRVADALLSEEQMQEAISLGLLLRMGFSLSAGVPDFLQAGSLSIAGEEMVLSLTKGAGNLASGNLERRLELAAKSMRLTPRFSVG